MKKTVGIFGGERVTKFITFDLDFEDLRTAGQVARELIVSLQEDFFIKEEQIVVSFSDLKGYHVSTLFFDAIINIESIDAFYNLVIGYLGYTKQQIELRGVHSKGVKLPLSINKKSGKRQHFVDLTTLTEISDSAIFHVQKVNKENFLDYLADFQAAQSEIILSRR